MTHNNHDLSQGQILVTGGAGFIGSALVAKLNQMGLTNIIIVDFLGNDNRFKNLIPLKFKDYIEGDRFSQLLADKSYLLNEITTIFHLGACSSTTEKDCHYLIENNYEYTKTLCNWALANDIRFVYASSAATYGNGDQGMDDKNEDLHRLRPMNMYGYSKHLFDLYAQRQEILDKIVGLKYFNVFGPNEQHKGEMRSLVNKAYHQILETKKIQLFKSYHPDYKDGEQVRDFLYVKDAVDMTIHLAQNKSAKGLYNLGSGIANTWITLAKAIFKAMNQPDNIEFIEMPPQLKDKYQYYTKADITKLRESGYKKSITPIDEAVKDYVQNYLIFEKYLAD